MLLAYANLNFGRAADHGNDVRRMAEKDADVIALVELRRLIVAEGFDTFQPDRKDGDVGGEGIFVRDGLRAFGRTKRQASSSLFGHEIGWRQILAVTLAADALEAKFDRFAVLVVHMPPLRMRGILYRTYARRLRMRLRRLNRKGIPWVVFGDWNWLIGNDPAGLSKAFGAEWFGRRIDGAAVHPRLVPFVRGVDTWDPPGRHDGHPYVYLNLGR